MNEFILTTDFADIRLSNRFVDEARKRWPGTTMVDDCIEGEGGELIDVQRPHENWVDPVIRMVGHRTPSRLDRITDIMEVVGG